MRVRRILAAAILLAAVCSFRITHNKPTTYYVTPQESATHMVTYVSEGGRELGECTATAIGPHALLTASHCADESDTTKIMLDLSTRRYRIKKILTDNRDHDIYLLDGPAFTNTVPYRTRQVKAGEHVYVWGDGEGQYPARRLDGTEKPIFDPSDVDAAQGEVHFTMPVIPGDSGSAVYADDGAIVAITTYRWDDDSLLNKLLGIPNTSTLDFEPNFTNAQIAEALAYDPSKRSVLDSSLPFFGYIPPKEFK